MVSEAVLPAVWAHENATMVFLRPLSGEKTVEERRDGSMLDALYNRLRALGPALLQENRILAWRRKRRLIREQPIAPRVRPLLPGCHRGGVAVDRDQRCGVNQSQESATLLPTKRLSAKKVRAINSLNGTADRDAGVPLKWV
jgi:hypothetical protein